MPLSEIVLSNYVCQKKQTSWIAQPFCIAFVYPKKENSFVVKGMSEDVRNYCEQKVGVALVNYTFWCKGNHRNIWQFVGTNEVYVFQREIKDRKRYVVSIYDGNDDFRKKKLVRKISFRRMPTKWIPEFNSDSKKGETMISANEARKLVERCSEGPEVQKFLDKIDKAIVNASNRGEKQVYVSDDSTSSAIQKFVLDQLKNLGYEVNYESDYRNGNYIFIRW